MIYTEPCSASEYIVTGRVRHPNHTTRALPMLAHTTQLSRMWHKRAASTQPTIFLPMNPMEPLSFLIKVQSICFIRHTHTYTLSAFRNVRYLFLRSC